MEVSLSTALLAVLVCVLALWYGCALCGRRGGDRREGLGVSTGAMGQWSAGAPVRPAKPWPGAGLAAAKACPSGQKKNWHEDSDSHRTTDTGELVHVFRADDGLTAVDGAGNLQRATERPDGTITLYPDDWPVHAAAGLPLVAPDPPRLPPGCAAAQAPYVTPSEGSPGGAFWDAERERCSVAGALARLYSTADVDPLIAGQMYQHADGMRNVYAQRTSHGDVHGLTEYSSSGGPGDVGVDVGPFGLAEYGGEIIGYDDGIPENYVLPSTPVRWYAPEKRDHYGPEGPTVYAEGLYSLQEPDHDPLMN